MRVTHIVPTVPPAFDGVGAYSMQIWRHWPEPKPEWHAICKRMPSGTDLCPPKVVLHPLGSTRESLAAALESAGTRQVVLQYVPHAYHAKGAPWWLAAGLSDWKRRTGGNLFVMFHELYATAPLYRVTGWFTPLAMATAYRLARLADGWATSCDRYYELILRSRSTSGTAGRLLPIGTNIDPVEAVDPTRPWPSQVGKKVTVGIFGFPGTRLAALALHKELIKGMMAENLLERVILIGQQPNLRQNEKTQMLLVEAGNVEVEQRFDVNCAVASKALAECHLGLANNPPDILTKSGSYAAYCAHGVVPVVGSTGAGQGVAPYLQHDTGDSSAALGFLRSAESMSEIRDRVLRLADSELSWPNIVSWYQNIASGVKPA